MEFPDWWDAQARAEQRVLNPWHLVLCRKIDQAIRRFLFKTFRRFYQAMIDEKRILASKEELTKSELERLTEINQAIGARGPYRFTPTANRLATDLIRQWKQENGYD